MSAGKHSGYEEFATEGLHVGHVEYHFFGQILETYRGNDLGLDVHALHQFLRSGVGLHWRFFPGSGDDVLRLILSLFLLSDMVDHIVVFVGVDHVAVSALSEGMVTLPMRGSSCSGYISQIYFGAR